MPDISNIDKNFHYDGKLGVSLSENETVFRVWAPEAEAVKVLLYNDQHTLSPFAADEMSKSKKGVWEISYDKCLEGTYYNFSYCYGGKWQEGVDIYANACGCNGERGYVADFSKLSPDGWENDSYVKLESYADAVLYETHIRDFSKNPSSGISEENRGKFLAFTEQNTRSIDGEKTCLSHIEDLGITHVHLLPAFDYEGVNEANPTDYNWGYNPKNYNIPEGSYSSDPFDPSARIIEFKKMVMSLHNKGIGVVMDVVYNHTFESCDSWFEIAYPKYYHRFKQNGSFSNGSGCGNEMASERKMCRRYIIDSVLWWAKEYHIDGFRFDLMALLDVDTMNEIVDKLKEINPSVIIYGEGWTGGECMLSGDEQASTANAKKTPEIAYFNDSYRDTIKGNSFVDEAKGYAAGNIHCKAGAVAGLLGKVWWAGSPLQTVNYCEAHDDLTLWDKLCVSTPGAHLDDHKKMARFSLALVFLAQGIPFIQAGQEFIRTKPLTDGKFDRNSYKSPDSTNSIKWDTLSKNKCESEYVKGLIQFRKANPLLRFKDAEEILEHHELLTCSDGMISLKLFDDNDEILILANPVPRAKMAVLPDGEWQVYISDIKAGNEPLATYCEGVFVPPISVMVLKKKNMSGGPIDE